MKGMCYIVLIIAFLMFYQREPVFSVIIIGIAIVLYLFFKSRKSSSRGRRGGFLSAITGRENDSQEKNIDDLITLMILQQLFSENSNKNVNQNMDQVRSAKNSQELEMQKIKEEILDLFQEE